MKVLITILILFQITLSAQVVETQNEKNNYYKLYSSDVKFINNTLNTKKFIKDLDLNILSYIKDNKLEEKVENFFYNGNYLNLKYISHYLKKLINSKALNLNLNDKKKICKIIKKYNKNSPCGENCFADIYYQKSKLNFWNYIPFYIKGYLKYIKSNVNTQIYFYSFTYFIIFFSMSVLLIAFIRSLLLLLKDIYSLIYLKRPGKESLFWTLSILFLSLYLLSFTPMLLLLIITAINTAYSNKKFILLFLFITILPFMLKFWVQKYNIYSTEISPDDRIAFEVIYTDILPTRKQIKKLKKSNNFFSNLALAKYYKSKGDLNRALTYYQSCLSIKKEGFLFNNIANIYALKGEYKKAVNYYNEAKYHNDDIIYFYNLSKVYYRLKDKERAQYYRNLAKNTSPDKLKELDKISTFHINRFFIDKYPSQKEFLKLYSDLIHQEQIDNHPFNINTQKYILNMLIAFFFYLFLLFTFRKKLKADYCQRCGIAFNNFEITERHKNFNLCASCYSMMNTRTTLKREDLIKKEKEVRIRKKFKKYKDIIVNIIYPGSFLFYKNESYLGIVFLLWQSFYLIVVIYFYKQWKEIINNNFFNFSMLIFLIIELSIYAYTYVKLLKRR